VSFLADDDERCSWHDQIDRLTDSYYHRLGVRLAAELGITFPGASKSSKSDDEDAEEASADAA
jgi:hypothetical protein